MIVEYEPNNKSNRLFVKYYKNEPKNKKSRKKNEKENIIRYLNNSLLEIEYDSGVIINISNSFNF